MPRNYKKKSSKYDSSECSSEHGSEDSYEYDSDKLFILDKPDDESVISHSSLSSHSSYSFGKKSNKKFNKNPKKYHSDGSDVSNESDVLNESSKSSNKFVDDSLARLKVLDLTYCYGKNDRMDFDTVDYSDSELSDKKKCRPIPDLRKELIPEPNSKTFSLVYKNMYSFNHWKYEVKMDVLSILEHIKNIPYSEISELIEYLTKNGLNSQSKTIGRVITKPLDLYIAEPIYNLICEHYMLDIKEVDILLRQYKNEHKNVKRNSYYNEIYWLDKLISKGYIPTESQKQTLIKLKYLLPFCHEYSSKKITTHKLITYLKLSKGIKSFFLDKNLVIPILKKNKLTLNTNFLIATILILKNNYMNNANYVFDIIDICNQCGLVFNLEIALIMVSNFSSLFMEEKINDFMNLIKENNIDEIKFLSEAIFLNSNTIKYLLKENKIDLLPQNLVIKCAILHNNLTVIEYFTNKKYIGTEEDLLYSLHVNRRQFFNGYGIMPHNHFTKYVIFEHFIKHGSEITSNVYEMILFYKLKSKYEHMFNKNLIEKSQITEKVKDAISSCDQTINRNIRYGKKKVFSASTKASDKSFIEICKYNSITDIVNYIAMFNIQTSARLANLIFNNSDLLAIEYFRFKFNINPSFFNIIVNCDLVERLFWEKVLRSNVLKTSNFEITNNQNNQNNQNNTITDVNKPNIEKIKNHEHKEHEEPEDFVNFEESIKVNAEQHLSEADEIPIKIKKNKSTNKSTNKSANKKSK